MKFTALILEGTSGNMMDKFLEKFVVYGIRVGFCDGLFVGKTAGMNYGILE